MPVFYILAGENPMAKAPDIRSPLRDTHLRIWEAVRKIPAGKVSTYGAIARLAGMPGQARLIGYALHALPEGAGVPWHRVVNAQGKISLPDTGGRARRQQRLIEAEGVRFTNGRISLAAHGWPRSAFRS